MVVENRHVLPRCGVFQRFLLLPPTWPSVLPHVQHLRGGYLLVLENYPLPLWYPLSPWVMQRMDSLQHQQAIALILGQDEVVNAEQESSAAVSPKRGVAPAEEQLVSMAKCM